MLDSLEAMCVGLSLSWRLASLVRQATVAFILRSSPCCLWSCSKFAENLLDGTLPATLGSFSKLKLINVARNRLSGRIPSELGNLTDLEELCVIDLSKPDLICQTFRRDTTFGCLCSCLDQNEFDGELPDSLGEFGKVTKM